MKKMKLIFNIVTGLLWISACYSYDTNSVKASVIVTKISGGFEVSLLNPSDKELCMHSGLWPNGDGGYVGYLDDVPELIYKSKIYDYKLRNSALGHRNEPLALLPGEILMHTFMFSDFEEAPKGADLSYAPTLWRCSNW